MSSEMRFVRKGIDDLMAELAALEDRVAELENRKAKSDTFDGRCVVSHAQVERWERIERAAKAFTDGFVDVRQDHHRLWFDLVRVLKP